MVPGSIPGGVAKFEGAVIPTLDLLGWDRTGIDLLHALNTPAQKRHLGGPETSAKLDERHARYLTYHRPGETEMLRIAVNGAIAGSIGYWVIERAGEAAYEAGWEVLPAFQGQGHGALAARLMMQRLRPLARHRYLFAFPTPENPGSNGVCRRLGFELLGVEEAEYPKGVWGPHNVWRLDLSTFAVGPVRS